MATTIGKIIEGLAEAGVYLAVQNGKLVCKARDGSLTAERRQLIGERKADFITYLSVGTKAPPRTNPCCGVAKQTAPSCRPRNGDSGFSIVSPELPPITPCRLPIASPARWICFRSSAH